MFAAYKGEGEQRKHAHLVSSVSHDALRTYLQSLLAFSLWRIDRIELCVPDMRQNNVMSAGVGGVVVVVCLLAACMCVHDDERELGPRWTANNIREETAATEAEYTRRA